MGIHVKDRATRPDERQCAMLVALLLVSKQTDVTRARLSETTLRRLFGRQRITPEFLFEVQEWLFRAGWVLFFAGASYAAVKVNVIEGWGRIASKRIKEDLEKVGRGEFDFDSLEHLLLDLESPGEDED
jgi:hypothetical protein